MRIATGVDENGDNLQSTDRMKDIVHLVNSNINEEIKLRALLLGLGSITKNYSKLGNGKGL